MFLEGYFASYVNMEVSRLVIVIVLTDGGPRLGGQNVLELSWQCHIYN